MVIPTYNKCANIELLVRQIGFSASEVDILVVDDNSPDGTAEFCEGLAEHLPRLHVLRRSGVRGLGQAYVDGLKRGLAESYSVVGTMDADLSHDPARLPYLLALLDGHDVVIGSRYVLNGGTVLFSSSCSAGSSARGRAWGSVRSHSSTGERGNPNSAEKSFTSAC